MCTVIYRRVDIEREGMRFYWRLAVAASWIGITSYLELDLFQLTSYLNILSTQDPSF